MYVPYQCCQKSFDDYYTGQTGNGLNYYQGSDFQRGYGFGGLFRSFFRSAVPLFKSGAKAVGKQLWETGLNVLNDVSRGDNIKVATKRRLKDAGKVLTDKAADRMKNMIGSGYKKGNKKRKLTKKRIIRSKTLKSKTRDIFN